MALEPISPISAMFSQGSVVPYSLPNDFSILEQIGKICITTNELVEEVNTINQVLALNIKEIEDTYASELKALALQCDSTKNYCEAEIKNITEFCENSTAYNILAGKRIVCYGDSITEGQTLATPPYLTNINYPKELARVTGAYVENRGAGGTTMSNLNPINCFCNRVETDDLSNFDYCIIMYGTNDYGYVATMGKPDYTNKNTFLGAYSYAIKKLITRYPNIKIILMTPPFADTQYKCNAENLCVNDYADGVIQIANLFHVGLIDVRNLLSVNEFNITEKYWDGKLHPTEKTYLELGQMVGNQLLGQSLNFQPVWHSLQFIGDATAVNIETIPYYCIINGFMYLNGKVKVNNDYFALKINTNYYSIRGNGYTIPIVNNDNGEFSFMVLNTDGRFSFGKNNSAYDLACVPPFYVGDFKFVTY